MFSFSERQKQKKKSFRWTCFEVERTGLEFSSKSPLIVIRAISQIWNGPKIKKKVEKKPFWLRAINAVVEWLFFCKNSILKLNELIIIIKWTQIRQTMTYSIEARFI